MPRGGLCEFHAANFGDSPAPPLLFPASVRSPTSPQHGRVNSQGLRLNSHKEVRPTQSLRCSKIIAIDRARALFQLLDGAIVVPGTASADQKRLPGETSLAARRNGWHSNWRLSWLRRSTR
jgi:hypothetical protein